MTVCEDFYGRINAFVSRKLEGYEPTPTSGKVIHDTIWGSVLYNGWEIQIIDSPLFQRLRDIRQLGRAETTYPSAHHTRFEHSLGTTGASSRCRSLLLLASFRKRVRQHRAFPSSQKRS